MFQYNLYMQLLSAELFSSIVKKSKNVFHSPSETVCKHINQKSLSQQILAITPVLASLHSHFSHLIFAYPAVVPNSRRTYSFSSYKV